MKISQITFKNVKAFIEGYTRKYMIAFFQNNLKHVFEQVEYRKEQVSIKSPECLEAGQCKHCGCKIPELFYANKACSNTPPCYREMLSKDDWTDKKNLESLQIN